MIVRSIIQPRHLSMCDHLSTQLRVSKRPAANDTNAMTEIGLTLNGKDDPGNENHKVNNST